MSERPIRRGFAARPADPEHWIKAADGAPRSSDVAANSARLTIDVTPDLRGRIKVAAFRRGVTVADMEQVYTERLKLNPGARELVAACKAAGLTMGVDSMGNMFATRPGEDPEALPVYMGSHRLDLLRERLIAHGRAADTPVAIIENGSRPQQRVLVGTLEELPELAAGQGVQSPALLVIGEVAALANRLHWYGAAPRTAEVRAYAQAA